jgi:hypothetical protein
MKEYLLILDRAPHQQELSITVSGLALDMHGIQQHFQQGNLYDAMYSVCGYWPICKKITPEQNILLRRRSVCVCAMKLKRTHFDMSTE